MIARLAAAAGAGVVALVIVAISLWFLGESLMVALELATLNPWLARLIVGLVGLVLALLIALIAKALAKPRRRRAAAASPSALADSAAQLGGMVAGQVVSATRSRPYTTILTALSAGLVVGILPELRSLVGGIVRRR